jgi:NAD(P)H-nitrite reductase large subunit
MSAASKAKRNDPAIDVVVLEQTSDVSYSACGMPYNIAEPERDMNDLVVRQAHVFRDKQGIDLRLGHRVERINRDRKIVSGLTQDGQPFEVNYDKLLIATGARPRMLNIPGEDLPGVKVLRSLEDGAHQAVHGCLSGSEGLDRWSGIGLEMAEAFHERKFRWKFATWYQHCSLASERDERVVEGTGRQGGRFTWVGHPNRRI